MTGILHTLCELMLRTSVPVMTITLWSDTKVWDGGVGGLVMSAFHSVGVMRSHQQGRLLNPWSSDRHGLQCENNKSDSVGAHCVRIYCFQRCVRQSCNNDPHEGMTRVTKITKG